MKYTRLIIAFLFLAGLALGCTSADQKSAAELTPSETAAAQLDAAQTETAEAAQAMKDYAYAQKTEFIDAMKKELADIEEELDRLSDKVDSSSGEAKAEAETQLKAVREQWTQTKNQLDQAENATESTWDDVKNGFNKSYSDLKDSFAKTRQWVSDKIEP